MISEDCRKAGNLLAGKTPTPYLIVTAQAYHEQCKGGTWCDCQCKTDPLVRRKNA